MHDHTTIILINTCSIRKLNDLNLKDYLANKYSFSASDNYEVRRILHKLERLPPDQRKLVIDDIRPEDFSSQEYARIRAINGDRAKDYLQVSIAILTYIVHEYLLYILKYV